MEQPHSGQSGSCSVGQTTVSNKHPPITTHPSTPLPDNSAGTLTTISSPLSPLLADDNPPHDDEKLYPSIKIEQMWNHILQTTVSPLYIKASNRPGAWFMIGSGRLGRAFPSDETRLRSGVALHLEDY
ncbi:hypothetical protein PILCRDRAFT_16591 [Piloderma croceum F 1598]|uniref:Uncharacterized protein n=1 Tax=Piloderma croceum (strain F 1598) TaxID=765440 RepID=A0A0C3ADR5_PILCF|nr:hypothetical protein PILCRDRAFT_16591 [Piloderma croceum F 1598]